MTEIRYKQSYAYSCGAVALMCAAGELGATSLGKHGKFAFLEKETPLTGNGGAVQKALMSWDGKEYAGATFANPKIEDAIYAITSGDMKSYSLPSRVVACARQLGLKSKIYVPSGVLSTLLQWNYPEELRKCQGQPDVEVCNMPPRGPAQDERELQIVTTWAVGLHYVLKRPAGSTYMFMDPADGSNYRTFDDMNSFAKKYNDTGISIIIKKKA